MISFKNRVPTPAPCHSGIVTSRVARYALAVNIGQTATWQTGSPFIVPTKYSAAGGCGKSK
nr:hypothetical protein [uncultured Flavobacterium sp.]